MIKAVIFDMDGVICHTNPFHSIAFKEFFAKRNLNPTEEEFKKHMYGKNNGYILSHFLGREIKGSELKELEFEKESLFRELYADHVLALPGFMDFLETLRSTNISIGVATSAPRANLDLILGKLGILDTFQSLLAEEDVSHHKPHPQVYLKSADNLNTLPQECLVFEDSFSGASAGLNAGMHVVGVLTSHQSEELPDCVAYISDFDAFDSALLKSL
ncbi:HAD family hydrolase [Algoriphagus namhaensis]